MSVSYTLNFLYVCVLLVQRNRQPPDTSCLGKSYEYQHKLRPEGSESVFVFITFRGFDVQVWCLHSFCSKFNGESDRIFRLWICSIFHGQNAWKTERVLGMTLVFGDFFMEKIFFFENPYSLKPSPISGLQKLRRHHIGTTRRFGDYRFPMNEWKMEQTVFNF